MENHLNKNLKNKELGILENIFKISKGDLLTEVRFLRGENSVLTDSLSTILR